MEAIRGEKQAGLARTGRIAWWCLLAGMILVICGARMWLIHYYGVSMPYFDEWTIEGKLFKAYLEHQLSPALMFQRLNEHHIFFSRVFLLGLFCANKQWDSVLFMVAQAPFGALGIAVLVGKLGDSMSGCGRAALAGFGAMMGVIPFGWENTIMGCEIHFYLAPLLGILVAWLCWRYEALSPRWWLGALLAFANLFTMASGVFFTAAAVGVLGLGLMLEPARRQKRDIAGVAILTVNVVCGLALPLAAASKLHVQSPDPAEFMRALTHVLSWPCASNGVWCVVQAPLILLALVLIIQRAPIADHRWFPVLMGAVFWIQAVATADRRFATWYVPRYRDSWLLLLIVIAACLYFLGKTKGVSRVLYLAFVALWSFVLAGGIVNNALYLLPGEILADHPHRLTMENNVRGYLRTGDATYLQGEIPTSRRDRLVEMLDSPSTRNVLPPDIFNTNPPLEAIQPVSYSDGFKPDGFPAGLSDPGVPVYGSYDKDKLLTKRGIALRFAVPHGTRQVDLQVAGSPDSASFEFKIKDGHTYREITPAGNSGLQWEMISINLNRGTTLFGMDATEWPGYEWTAFSAPEISTRPALGRWAQEATGCFAGLLTLGLAMMAAGAVGSVVAKDGLPGSLWWRTESGAGL